MKIYDPNGRKVYPDTAMQIIVRNNLAPLKTIIIQSEEGYPLIVRTAISRDSKYAPEIYSPNSKKEYVIKLKDKLILEQDSNIFTMDSVLDALELIAQTNGLAEGTVEQHLMRFKTGESVESFIEELLGEGFKYQKATNIPVVGNPAKNIIGKITPGHQ